MNKHIISITLIIAAFLAAFFIRGAIAHRQQLKAIAQSVEGYDSKISYWKDSYNVEHAKNIAVQADEESISTLYVHKMDSLSERLRIARKNIEAFQNVTAQATGGYTAKVIHDTLQLTFHHTDSFFTEKVVIRGDSARVDWSISMPINLTQYWRRSWFLGRKTHYIDGYSDMPNVHITNLKSVRINAKEPRRWGIGPQVGITYDNGLRPTFGLSLSYQLIRF